MASTVRRIGETGSTVQHSQIVPEQHVSDLQLHRQRVLLGHELDGIDGLDMGLTEVGDVTAPGRRGTANQRSSRERQKDLFVVHREQDRADCV